jgi:hypothetical protein
VRLSWFLKGILPANLNFQGGERLILLKIGLLSLVDKIHVSLETKPSVLEAAASRTLFPCEIELVFERNTSCKS